MGRSGFRLRIAVEAVFAMSAKRLQSGSRWKFQCDRLLGSFQSTTASTTRISCSKEPTGVNANCQLFGQKVQRRIGVAPCFSIGKVDLRLAQNGAKGALVFLPSA